MERTVHGYHLDHERERDDVFVPAERNPLTSTVTRFVFDYITAYIHGPGGGFWTESFEPERLIRGLTEAFPVHARWDDTDVFEADNVMVRVGPSIWTEQIFLDVKAFKHPLRKQMPAILRDYVRRPGGTDDPIPF